jgi:hypothetical protein
MSDDLQNYRNSLISIEQKSQDDFDKAVLSLSGGALGITFVFLKDVVGIGPLNYKSCLFWAWICWGVSVTATLFSYALSNFSLRKTIQQVDNNTIYDDHPGGWPDKLLIFLNLFSGFLFLIGVVLFATFIWYNLEAINVRQK